MQLNAAMKTLLNFYQSLIALSCYCSPAVTVELFGLCLHWNPSSPEAAKAFGLYFKFRVEIFEIFFPCLLISNLHQGTLPVTVPIKGGRFDVPACSLPEQCISPLKLYWNQVH